MKVNKDRSDDSPHINLTSTSTIEDRLIALEHNVAQLKEHENKSTRMEE